ncbi:Methyltransferase small domain-containing protein [Plasmodiophora brassicae]|uniref:Methyltransferase small domain-containing protein n=1 Tax=Plasmodiophora brassicae TaxID=37360 RepID=A0A0G4IMF2_PLABS|nr:hypothetical protein PBRA_005097 [Plasmodiophora brassicae]SPQ99366.1 unnamed protein product [Plasmodiophora brassicae]
MTTAAGPGDPDVAHLTSADFDHVYEMGEDTFLLMSVLDDHIAALCANAAPRVCVEIGSGSGIVSAHLSNLIRYHSARRPIIFATDVNEKAAEATSKTFAKNAVRGEVIVTDLASALERRLSHRVDVLVFNPPYVPSPASELRRRDLTAAWAGGINGAEVIERFLPAIDKLLSPHGMLFLVLIEANLPDVIFAKLESQGFHCQTLARRHVAGERLRITGITRQQ